ncbi:alanine--tRNA ligase-related protein [Brevibacterium linens]|nr:alanine--tRNA ligase-related protein [Brevibacterium linens]SMY01523.1 alanyl-tRNA synthetase [Brevibacterium linens ATCC 9172]
MPLRAQHIRTAFLDYYQGRGHTVIPRSGLVAEEDGTTLFTGSGMQPLMPYLLGEPHPSGLRLANCQPAVRAQDMVEVGDNRHTSFFEMLGNWSLGDYFKEQQIRWFFDFLTRIVGLDPHRLYVTVFGGDVSARVPRDEEAAQIWKQVFADAGIEAQVAVIGTQSDGDARGISPGERIFFYGDEENWWSRGKGLAGTPVGDPCGPDSEVFFDFGPEHHDPTHGLPHPASESGRFMEIGNQVFMQYQRQPDGTFTQLTHRNVDFGGGLERITAAANDDPDIFQISALRPIIEHLEKLSGRSYRDATVGMRVIADHLRAAVFMIVAGVRPANKERGYVLRRLVRRAIRYGQAIGIQKLFLPTTVSVITVLYNDNYPELDTQHKTIMTVLEKEERVFLRTLRKGLEELHRRGPTGMTGKDIFTLYDTFGFPTELAVEEVLHSGYSLCPQWRDTFDRYMQQQRARSRTTVLRKGPVQ